MVKKKQCWLLDGDGIQTVDSKSQLWHTHCFRSTFYVFCTSLQWLCIRFKLRAGNMQVSTQRCIMTECVLLLCWRAVFVHWPVWCVVGLGRWGGAFSHHFLCTSRCKWTLFAQMTDSVVHLGNGVVIFKAARCSLSMMRFMCLTIAAVSPVQAVLIMSIPTQSAE